MADILPTAAPPAGGPPVTADQAHPSSTLRLDHAVFSRAVAAAAGDEIVLRARPDLGCVILDHFFSAGYISFRIAAADLPRLADWISRAQAAMGSAAAPPPAEGR